MVGCGGITEYFPVIWLRSSELPISEVLVVSAQKEIKKIDLVCFLLIFMLNLLPLISGFALSVAIIAKCEEKIFLAQKNIIWRIQVAKKNSPLKISAPKNAT